MGFSNEYADVPNWVAKPEGYQTGAMVKYNGNVFYANFWASEPGVGDADHNGWRFYDELYDQTPHTPTAQAKIIAYIPTWRTKEGFNYANDEMYQSITHGIIAFLTFDETKLGEFDSKSLNDVNAILANVIYTGHRNGTYISIALGGAEDYGFLNLMTAIGNNSAHPLLDQAVQNVVNFVRANSLDGVDLDLECWWGKPGEQDQGGRPKSAGPHPAGYALTLFAQKLKQAMPDKLVSAAVFGTSWYGNNYDSQIANSVDWLAIMTYDLTGSWNASPVGPHTALLKIRNQASARPAHTVYQESYANEQQGAWSGGGPIDNPILSVEDTLWYWTNPLFVNWQGGGQKIPRNKIAAGVPIYGYDFAHGKNIPDAQSGKVPPGYKDIRYKDILAQFPDAYRATNGNIKVPGNTSRPPFISAPGTYPFAHNIYFETPDTAVTKLNFLKNLGAQGVIIWELSNDVWEEGKSIIKALYRSSGNPAVKPPIETSLKAGYWIVNKKSGMAITAPANPGEQIYQFPFDSNNPNPAQIFLVENSKIRCVSNPALVLDVKGNSGEDQAPIIVWTENDEPGQKFRFYPTTAGHYLIRPRPGDANEERFRLAVSQGSIEANAAIVQDAWWAQGSGVPWEDNQQWRFIQVANGKGNFTASNWMSQISEDRKLSELNIPGTHESCAIYGSADLITKPLVVCQTLSLQEQLEAGIRFIDIRCRHIGDREGNSAFAIHHGIYYQNLNFGAGVQDVCIDFLKKNPKECIIMSIKEEDVAPLTEEVVLPAGRTFENTLNQYITDTKSFWYLAEKKQHEPNDFDGRIPTLKEVRGKIVLFRRYGNGSKGIAANPTVWRSNATFSIPHPNGNLIIQDEYEVPTFGDLNDKWGKIENLLSAAERGREDDWYINFLSGTFNLAILIGGIIGPFNPKSPVPRDVAKAMNPRLFDFLQSKSSGRFGTLLMDFPDDSLISTIISLNSDIGPVGK